MNLASDPAVRSAPKLREMFDQRPLGGPLAKHVSPAPPAPRPARTRIAVYAALTVVTVALTLRVVASLLATPLERMPAALSPTWLVELSTTNASPTTALLYGPDVGVQLVRVPGNVETAADARVVPARLARGEVHFISLGLARLQIRARSPQPTQRMAFVADGRIITAYQSTREIGVRSGW